MKGYLPKESPNTKLNKTILRTIWNNKLISKSLGVKNENKAREWFREHEEYHQKFETWNKELEKKMKELQTKAGDFLSSFKDIRGQKRLNKSRILPKLKRNKH
jgi:hypothetical protein